ncbi:MAG TPA: translocation/assembly module TamB domain-containing protein [Candidatus Angelobacter sp.]|nr:translocation/assembly module TamB domain-containing protein [Candidatus Angelobacter sp.]
MALRKRRKIFLVLLSVVLLAGLVIAAFPLWFPWALRPVAKRYGATYADFRRIGYQQFQLTGFALTNRTTHLQAGQVRALVPTVWLWRHVTGARSQGFLEVHSWNYEYANSAPSRSTQPASARSTFQNLQSLAGKLNRWLTTAALTNGAVSFGNQRISIPEAVWVDGNLAGSVSYSNVPPLSVTIAAQTVPWKLRVDSETNAFQAALSIDNRANNLSVTGTADWMTNRFNIAANFPSHGFIPDSATLRANAFNIPARLLGLKEYGGVTGALQAAWQTNHFNAQLDAHAAPEMPNLPPLDVALHVTGDTNAARLSVAKISAPGLQAGLSAPALIQFKPPFLSEPATLNVALDLDQQHWFVAGGKLAGQAVVYPGGKVPRVTFALSGANINTTSLTTSNLQMTGELDWPVLDLKNAQIVMDDASKVSLAGQYDLRKKTVQNGRLNSSGPFGGQFLPADYSFETASISARFAGPIQSPATSLKAQVTRFQAPNLAPVDIEAAVDGKGLNLTNLEATLKATNSTLSLRGSASLATNKENLTLTALELSDSNHVALRLDRPAQIALEKKTSGTNQAWGLVIDPIRLAADGREFRLAADVAWPERGAIECDAHELDARLLSGFIPKANVAATLNHFTFAGGWTNGPVAFQLTSDATLKTREDFPFSAVAKISGGAGGIAIEHLSILNATQIVSQAEGALPATFNPAAKDGVLQIDTEAPLNLHVLTDPNSVLWKKIAATTGLHLDQPDLVAHLEGTWAAPKGQVTLRVRRMELAGTSHPLPAVENVDFLAVMDRATARIERCRFDIEKQPVNLTGEIPLGKRFWTGLRHKRKLPDWRDATAHLTINHAQLAAFTSMLPQILSPEGTASADISLERGGKLQGEFSVANARTYPLESIGPVRNIQAVARLNGQKVQLENASGEVGGQRVNIDGGMDLNEQIWRTNGLPLFHVHLNGTNVPLARNPSVLLRADLDLTATNSGTEIPVVYGSVRLRNSLFLADLRTLVPEKTASARKRPPYFSIEAKPWADWRLKVNVVGDSFLRVRTPLFAGKVSTVLRLEGTLKEPLALGQVKIDPGSAVTFPFSSLDVKQGFVSLTSEDPYHPQLFVTAQGRRFGYDVKMEATGPVDAPVVQFSSVPGLSSEDIVLMLTAGQIPRGVGATATAQQRAQGLALFVGKNLLSDFGLGGGGQDRLTIRSGEEISESGRPTYDIEYKLTDRWSVIGEYDRFDQYNLNLKFKAYSK